MFPDTGKKGLTKPDTLSYSVSDNASQLCPWSLSPIPLKSVMDRTTVPHDVPDAEMKVLEALWEMGLATIRQLTDLLYPDGGDASYATVQKLLERLEHKGYVGRDRSLHAHRFFAQTDRETLVNRLVGQRLRVMAEKLCGGMMGPLLTHL